MQHLPELENSHSCGEKLHETVELRIGQPGMRQAVSEGQPDEREQEDVVEGLCQFVRRELKRG